MLVFLCIETSYRNKGTAFSCFMKLFIYITKQKNTDDIENNYQNHHIHIKKMLLMLCSVSVMVLLVRDKVSFTPAFLGPCTFSESCSWNCFSFGPLAMWAWDAFNLKKKPVFAWWLCFLCKIAFWMSSLVYDEKDVVKWNQPTRAARVLTFRSPASSFRRRCQN